MSATGTEIEVRQPQRMADLAGSGPLPAQYRERLIRARAGSGHIDEAECESCGVWLGRSGGECQRRAPGGSGACRDEVIESAANWVLLCGPCAGRQSSLERQMRDDAQGFWIRHGSTPEFDPRLVPVLLYVNGGSGIPVWLGELGGYLFTPPQVTAA
jgi:hypothetical protein